MRELLKTQGLTIVVGIGLAILLFAVPWEYCMAGDAYGFPFPWYHPNHDEPGEIPVGNGDMAFEPGNLLASAAVWLVAVVALAMYSRRVARAGLDSEDWPPKLGG